MNEVYIPRGHETSSLNQRVLGATAMLGEAQFVTTAYHTLSGRTVTYDAFTAELERLGQVLSENTETDEDVYKLDPATVNEWVTHSTLHKLAGGDLQRYDNVLVGWPIYQDLHDRFVRRVQGAEAAGGRPQRALMIGGYAISSAAFMALAEDVFDVPSDNAIVADPVTSAYGRNERANGLALPAEWTGTMSVVLTNSLLHMILGTDSRVAMIDDVETPPVMVKLLENAHRVLRPGGHLLMHEFTPGYDWTDREGVKASNRVRRTGFERQLANCLMQTGFSIDTIEEAAVHAGNFLDDPTRKFAAYDRIPRFSTLTVCAHKPEDASEVM